MKTDIALKKLAILRTSYQCGWYLKEAVRKVFVFLCEMGDLKDVCTLVVGSGPEKRRRAGGATPLK